MGLVLGAWLIWSAKKSSGGIVQTQFKIVGTELVLEKEANQRCPFGIVLAHPVGRGL